MLRSLFLYLSVSKWAQRLLMALPFAGRVSRRFVAGETLDKAIQVTCNLNEKGMTVALDLLGESVHTDSEAVQAADAYIGLLEAMEARGVNAYASLKLTALGLDISEELCLSNMRRILSRSIALGRFVRIDMEGSAYTERTLRVFHTLIQEFPKNTVGIVIQSYLRRSESDMRALAVEGAFVRLVKGAYKELPEVAFPDKADVDASFVRLMELYLSDESRVHGGYIAIATHDPKMIQAARQFTDNHHIDKKEFEFQMLYGVRTSLQEQLASEGYQVRVYVPYGTHWYPYFMRRLAERPANVWFIARNFFRE